jgi:hypothetical protein
MNLPDIFVLIEPAYRWTDAAKVLALTLDPQVAAAWKVEGRQWVGRAPLSERPFMSHMALGLDCLVGDSDA